MRATVAGLALLSCLTACNGELLKPSRLNKLRVLAVQAEPAELVIQPGQPLPKTRLFALVFRPASSPDARFALCVPRAGAALSQLDCPGADGLPLPGAGTDAATLDLNDPRFGPLLQQAGPALAQGAIEVPVGFVVSGPPGGDPPPDGAVAPDGLEHAQGLDTVRIRNTGGPANRNPSLTALAVGPSADGPFAPIAADGSTQVKGGVKVRLLPQPTADSKEPTPDGPEKLTFSFAATGGDGDYRSADTTTTGEPGDPSADWTPPPVTVATQVTLICVVRDGRGGVGWLIRTLRVVP